MATSGSYDYNPSAREIIEEALALIGVLGVGETPSSEDMATCRETLNMILKAWQGEGVGIWKNTEFALFPSYEGYEYSVGPSGDHATSSWVKTELAVAAASGANTIDVDSIADISDGDYIGIELDDNSLQWTTVNGSPSGSTVTLTDALTDSAAVDNHIYAYTSKLQRPVWVMEARLHDANGRDRPLQVVGRDEYMALADKATTGAATQVYYHPSLTNGKLYVWPACDDVQEYIKGTCRIPIEDIDRIANDFDMPQEWFLALSQNLAVAIAPKFSMEPNEMLVLLAQQSKESAAAYDVPQESVRFQIRLTR